jgi:hypothetical protein
VIATALKESLDDDLATQLRDRVENLAAKLPLYPHLDGELA